MVAHELRAVITDMQKEDPQAKCLGFEQQFKVEYILVSDLTLQSEYEYDVGSLRCYAAFARTVSGSMHSRHQLCTENQHNEEEQIQRQVPL